jgi:hypothetical protein
MFLKRRHICRCATVLGVFWHRRDSGQNCYCIDLPLQVGHSVRTGRSRHLRKLAVSRVLGWSALLGVAVACVTYGLNYPLMKYNIKVRRSSFAINHGVHFIQFLDHSRIVEGERPEEQYRRRTAPEYTLPQVLRMGYVSSRSLAYVLIPFRQSTLGLARLKLRGKKN